jgi:hypothetical protein
VLHIATCLWDANEKSSPASRCYDESWVEKLYRGFRCHLTIPFRFVCFTERARTFAEPIEQERFRSQCSDYGLFTEPYRLNQPMILVGLDTIVVANIDHLAQWCLTGDKIAAPRDPKSYRLKSDGYPDQCINGVTLVPVGWRKVFDEWRGENDMVHLRRYPWEPIDDRWPGEVVSYKLRIRPDSERVRNAKIIYFHGQPKPCDLTQIEWVRENWK